jgi:hypothetical protein
MILNIVIILITRILKTIVSSYSFFSSHSILFWNFLKLEINIFFRNFIFNRYTIFKYKKNIFNSKIKKIT